MNTTQASGKMQNAGSKRQLRDFDMDELLFRKPVIIEDPQTFVLDLQFSLERR